MSSWLDFDSSDALQLVMKGFVYTFNVNRSQNESGQFARVARVHPATGDTGADADVQDPPGRHAKRAHPSRV